MDVAERWLVGFLLGDYACLRGVAVMDRVCVGLLPDCDVGIWRARKLNEHGRVAVGYACETRERFGPRSHST